MLKKFIFVLITLIICSTTLTAQDQIFYEVGTYAITGTNDRNPFWLHANRYGQYPETGTSGLIDAKFVSDLSSRGLFDFRFGTEVISRIGQVSEPWIHQAYLQTNTRVFQLKAGWQEETFGLNEESHIGSFIWSRNTKPMPKVTIRIPGFYPISGTNEFLSIRGHLTHGWFEEERHIRDAYLHDKAGYLKFGNSREVHFIAGLHHSAQWGGVHPTGGRIAGDWTDYIKIFLARGGGSDTHQLEQENALGNHLGEWEVAVNIFSGSYKYTLYKSFPFEDGSGKDLRTAQDGIFGFYLRNTSETGWLDNFSYEFINSKWQSGPARTDAPETSEIHYDSIGFKYGGRDNFFNNHLFRDGWSYKARTMGLPFISYSDQASPGGLRFPNNRILSHTLGLGMHFGELHIDALYSYVENFGNYHEMLGVERNEISDYKFIPPLIQHSMLFSLEYPLQFLQNTILTADIGADIGELYRDSVGIILGLNYSGRKSY